MQTPLSRPKYSPPHRQCTPNPTTNHFRDQDFMSIESRINYGDELILAVDDEKSIRELLGEMLDQLGFKVHFVAGGSDAIQELKRGNYTLLLTDIGMPDMDGLELIKRVKNYYPDICAIAMTGYSREYKYVDVVNAGASDFINKPFGLEELEAKIRRAIIERNIKQELNRLSITDSLTGLYNQRHFYDRLRHEIVRAQRQKNQLALILLDLDNFKQYNDTYGHLAGDELLRKVGSIINIKIREGVDSGYRYGGDEFAIILIDANQSIGHHILKRVEMGIEEECKLSASVGYAHFLDGMKLETIVEKADQLLYKSKEDKKHRKDRANLLV